MTIKERIKEKKPYPFYSLLMSRVFKIRLECLRQEVYKDPTITVSEYARKLNKIV